MDDQIKYSIPAIILKDLAKILRLKYESYDIKAHPISLNSSILVVKNDNFKCTLQMSAGSIGMWRAICQIISSAKTKYWLAKYNNQPHNKSAEEYILSAKIVPKNMITISPIGVNILNPNSIDLINEWAETTINAIA